MADGNFEVRKRSWGNLADNALFALPAQPSKRARIEGNEGPQARSTSLPDGIYRIVNVFTGASAGLSDDADGSELINITPGLQDNDRDSQWSITHLQRDQYKIQSVRFELFASHYAGPRVEGAIIGKTSAVLWTIRLAQPPNVYNISPTQNPDIFWMSTSDVHGTPLEFGQSSTARRCRWSFEVVRLNTEPLVLTDPSELTNKLSQADINNLLEKLPSIQSARYEADSRSKCLEGTRVELLQTIRDWATNPTSSPIFWLRGQAGTGKTTICLTVADECDRRNQLGASFMFSRDQVDRSELQHVFSTIAHQLGRLHEPYRAKLVELLSKDTGVATLQPSFQLERLIVEPLQQCDEFPSPTVIVIDALDECKDKNPISTLLSVLQSNIHRLPQFKFFITSRPEPHIQSSFAGELRHETTSLALHDIQSTEVDRDIALVIRTILSHARPDLASQGWPPEEAIRKLVRRSAQLFIYAATAIRMILDPEWGNPEGRLVEVLESSAEFSSSSVALDQLYLAILRAAYPIYAPIEVVERLKTILGTIIALTNPLPAMDLANLLGLERRKLCVALQRMHSVIVVPATDAAPIRIIHPSFFDFLTVRCADNRFSIKLRARHSLVAIHCFGWMRQELRRNICQIDNSSKQNRDIDDLDVRIRRFIPPSLQYACKNWAVHLIRSGVDQMPLDHLKMFLNEHLLHWIEVLSLLDFVGEGAKQIRNVLSLFLGRCSNDQMDVVALLRDCDRFIWHFSDTISESASHTYLSAFGLLPQESLLRQTYAEQVTDSLRAMRVPRATFYFSKFSDHSDRLLHWSPSFSSNGNYVSCSAEGETQDGGSKILVWDVVTASLFATLRLDQTTVWSQFLPNSTRVACGSPSHNLTIWKVGPPSSTETISLQVEANPSPNVQYASDPNFSVLGMLLDCRAVRLWDTGTWRLRHELIIPLSASEFSALDSDPQCRGFEVAVWSSSHPTYFMAMLVPSDPFGTVHILQVHPDSPNTHLVADISDQAPTCLALSPDGRRLAVGTQSGKVLICDTESGLCMREWCSTRNSPISVVTFTNHSGEVLYVNGDDTQSKLWFVSDDNSDGGLLYGRHLGSKVGLACSVDGQVACAGDGLVVGAPKALSSVRSGHDWKCKRSWMTPNGSHCVSFLEGGSIGFLNIETGGTWVSVGFHVSCAVASSNGQHIAAGGDDGDVLLYDLHANPEPYHLGKHSNRLTSVGFSQDGTMIISLGRDDVVWIWDVRSHRRLDRFVITDYGGTLPGSLLPSPIWRVDDPEGNWVDQADAGTLEFTRLDAATALLCVKSQVTSRFIKDPSGTIFYHVDSNMGPITVEVYEPSDDCRHQATRASAPIKTQYYFEDGSVWVWAQRGEEERRIVSTPFDWTSFDDPEVEVANGHILLKLRESYILLDVRDCAPWITEYPWSPDSVEINLEEDDKEEGRGEEDQKGRMWRFS